MAEAAARPRPPEALTDPFAMVHGFVPAPELLEWLLATFVAEGAPLANPDHAHLYAAKLGCLWTNSPNSRAGRTIVGQAEYRPPGMIMGKWARGRAQAQLYGWFGQELDFLLTFDAIFAARCSDAEFCALVEHELYHCGQARDEFGMPKFAKSGMPVLELRGHDVEQFIGVVRRYGADAALVRALADAAAQTADVPAERIAQACGTCVR